MSKPLTTMRRLCAAVIAADKAAGRDPAESRAWLRDCFLPALMAEELVVGDVRGPHIDFVPAPKVWVVTIHEDDDGCTDTTTVGAFRAKPTHDQMRKIGSKALAYERDDEIVFEVRGCPYVSVSVTATRTELRSNPDAEESLEQMKQLVKEVGL